MAPGYRACWRLQPRRCSHLQPGFLHPAIQLILCRAGKGNVAWDIPDTFIFLINGSWNFIQVFFNASPAHFFDLLLPHRDGFRPCRRYNRSNRSELRLFEFVFFSMVCTATLPAPEITTTLPSSPLSMPAQHIFQHIDEAVSRCLGTDRGTRKRGLFLSGRRSGARPALYCPKKADFPGAGPDIACRDIQIVPDIFEQLRHEALAEGHTFAFGFSPCGQN